jgi:hypothetical protein
MLRGKSDMSLSQWLLSSIWLMMVFNLIYSSFNLLTFFGPGD